MRRKISELPEEHLKKRRDFGVRLEEERQRLEFTQKQMAENIDISLRTYMNWASGNKDISIEVLEKLALIDIDVIYLLIGQKQPQRLSPKEMQMIHACRELDPKMLTHVQSIIQGLGNQATHTESFHKDPYGHKGPTTVGQHFQGNHQNFAPFSMHVDARSGDNLAERGKNTEEKSK